MKKNSEHIINDYLVARYQEGDKEALKELIRQFNPSLERQIYAQTRDKTSLDDLVQESWYAIISGLSTLKIRISFDVWALSIARRKAIDWIRHQQSERKRAQEIYVNEQIQHTSAEGELEIILERKAKVNIAIKRLPYTQRVVLSMFYLENYSVKEISEILVISAGTVKSRLYNAREHLKEIFNTK
ncbi:MAG: sigma-70 family RNA polymerase sigma factor [Balneolaceae bacterium]